MLAGRAWDDLTAASIADAAGLDVIVFPEHYPSVAACGADALDRAARDCLDACADAYPSWQGCAERFFGLSGTVLRWVETRPGLAPLLFVVPEQTREPALVARVGAFKRELAGLFDRPGRCTPAGRTHVEFVIGAVLPGGLPAPDRRYRGRVAAGPGAVAGAVRRAAVVPYAGKVRATLISTEAVLETSLGNSRCNRSQLDATTTSDGSTVTGTNGSFSDTRTADG